MPSKILGNAIELNKFRYDETNNRINFVVDVYSNNAPIADVTAGVYANSAFETANVVVLVANAAFDQANAAYTAANTVSVNKPFPSNNDWGYFDLEYNTAFGEKIFLDFYTYDAKNNPLTELRVIDLEYLE